MSPCGDKVNKIFSTANLSTRIVIDKPVLCTVAFHRIVKLEVYSLHKLKIFGFLWHSTVNWHGVLIKKVIFVRMLMKSFSFQRSVTELQLFSLGLSTQWYKVPISCQFLPIHKLGKICHAALHKVHTQTIEKLIYHKFLKDWYSRRRQKSTTKRQKVVAERQSETRKRFSSHRRQILSLDRRYSGQFFLIFTFLLDQCISFYDQLLEI